MCKSSIARIRVYDFKCGSCEVIPIVACYLLVVVKILSQLNGVVSGSNEVGRVIVAEEVVLDGIMSDEMSVTLGIGLCPKSRHDLSII